MAKSFDEQKKLLETKRDELEGELGRFATKDPNVEGDWDSKYPRVPEGNLEEAADEVSEYTTRIHVEHSLELSLKEITDALKRIEDGTYGTCSNCNKPISAERLKISPEAKTCKNCTG